MSEMTLSELDDLLNSVPNLEISKTGKEGYGYGFGEYQWFDAFATVRVYEDDDRSPDARYSVYESFGNTRSDALIKAVALAKEAHGE